MSETIPFRAFEIAVIGGGPGGYVAAIRAAQLGFRVAVVDQNPRLGGTCLNAGCIPSKALLASSEYYHMAREKFADHGIAFDGLRFDLDVMMRRKDRLIDGLGKGIDGLMKKNRVERITGTARLLGPHEIEVTAPGQPTVRLEAENIILATGSTTIELPFLPFDGSRVIPSDAAIALAKVPGKLLVIGAGAIGLELASVWSRLGSEVTVIEFLPRIAAGFDEEISRAAQRLLEGQGLKFFTGTKVERAEREGAAVTLHATRDGESLAFAGDLILVAVGRKPHTEGLGAEEAGIEMTAHGRIKTNEHWQTSVPSIYAIGDVTDGPMLAHKAEEEGVAVAERLAGKPGHVNRDVIPNVIYTSPEIAAVGLTAEQAKERGHEVKTGKISMMTNGRALANGFPEGFAKMVADAKTDRVLGVQMIAHGASELIGETVVLMEFGGSSEDLGRTIHAHPTMSEVLKEAALAVENRAIHG
jgi:dihydrolipoamide dehydrogenase